MDKKEVMDGIGEVMSRFDEVEMAYIFGSFIRSNDFNDIDVALLVSKELNPYEKSSQFNRRNWAVHIQLHCPLVPDGTA